MESKNEGAASNSGDPGGPASHETSPPHYNFQCYICDKTFSANSNLNRHLRKIHKENVQSPYNNVKCALCDSVYLSSICYHDHLEKDHRVNIETEHWMFATKESFEEWKLSIEAETTAQFIKSRGEKKSRNVNKTYFSCNRSGYYVSKARTRKALKKQGSRKINGRCPASMNVTVNSDLSYDVRFIKTHVGHDFELKHLDLSSKDRDLVFQKLEEGLTKRDIIKHIRSHADQRTSATNSPQPGSAFDQSPSETAEISVLMSTSATTEVNSTESEQVDESPITNDSKLDVPLSPVAAASIPENPPQISDLALIGRAVSRNSKSPAEAPKPTSRLHLLTTKDIHNIIKSKQQTKRKRRQPARAANKEPQDIADANATSD